MTYREKLFTLMGDRNPLEVMAQTASTLAEIVRTHPAAVLRRRPFAGKWTPNEIIGHLADGEWVYGYRLRLILCEDNPAIAGTKQDSWVAALHNPSSFSQRSLDPVAIQMVDRIGADDCVEARSFEGKFAHVGSFDRGSLRDACRL